jgi:hypothetical protein
MHDSIYANGRSNKYAWKWKNILHFLNIQAQQWQRPNVFRKYEIYAQYFWHPPTHYSGF